MARAGKRIGLERVPRTGLGALGRGLPGLRALLLALLLSSAAWPTDLGLSDSLTTVLLGPTKAAAPSFFLDASTGDLPALCQSAEGHIVSCSRPMPVLRGSPNGTALLRPLVLPSIPISKSLSDFANPRPVCYHLRAGGADAEDSHTFDSLVS